jgi:hypothetical protein
VAEPTAKRRSRGRFFVGLAVGLAAIVLLSGLAAGGLAGMLMAAGIVLLCLGLGALAVGRARWARISGRRTATVVAVAGLAAAVLGGLTAPTPRAAPVAAAPSSSAASPSLAADEAAIATAEASLTDDGADQGGGVGNGGPGTVLSDPAAAATVDSAAAANPTSALAALSAIPVKGRAPMTGYARDQFGSGWVDTDRNGCDTRNDVLARDLTGETFKAGTRDCVVLTGSLADPYSGRAIAFQRGVATSTAVQIDHVVALGDAWQTGAQAWDTATRTRFANDPRELLAVDGPLNEQKGDGDAATWLPPNRSYRCAYVARQVAVKVAYGLWMTQAEKDASATVLATCPTQTLPDGVVASVVATTTAAPATTTAAPRTTASAPRTTAPAPRTTAAPAPRTTVAPAPAPGGGSAYYANCTAARAAGAAPIYRGQPGYSSTLDRDGDGVACEN